MRSRPVAATLSIVLQLAVMAALAACGSSGSGGSGGTGGGMVTVGNAWVRAAAAGQMTAGYMTITNGTLADDTLVGVSSAAAQAASIHETTTDGSMTAMHPVEGLVIPAGKTVTLEPGGYHVMLEGLTGDLAPGSSVAMTLTLENAGPLNVQAEVRSE